jgi:hypothetical protein
MRLGPVEVTTILDAEGTFATVHEVLPSGRVKDSAGEPAKDDGAPVE